MIKTMEQNWNEKLLQFISESPTAWHVCANLAKRLRAEGYTELLEQEEWNLRAPGNYFVRRNGSALIAFRLPADDVRGFLLMAAHGDSPSFRVKDHGAVPTAGMYASLSVEKYGGMLCASWMDRPLSVAGRVAVKTAGGVETRLVNLRRDLLLIPNVAIHMDRTVNEGKRYDLHVDMLPIFGSEEQVSAFDGLIAEAAGANKEDLIATELLLYPRTPGSIWGAAGEYLSSPRLDDQQCVFACTEGFLASREKENAPVLCVFDNEEVGSGTKQGADSDFLRSTLERICRNLDLPYHRLLANSFLVSADNAHAVHPNHPEYADRNDRPEMNKGVVIKSNASQKYTTDALSGAVFAAICEGAGVPVQRFTNRADLAGGSTLGNISGSQVSVPSVDVGLAQLAMHSAYETAGALDTAYLIRAAEAFFGSPLRRTAEGFRLDRSEKSRQRIEK